VLPIARWLRTFHHESGVSLIGVKGLGRVRSTDYLLQII
jgi:hypothetical protein